MARLFACVTATAGVIIAVYLDMDTQRVRANAEQRRSRKSWRRRLWRGQRNNAAAAGPFSWLRPAREREGVTLEDIAEHTKIPLHLLQELERGDVHGWPGGIYAKAYARAYAAEIGLDSDQVVNLIMPHLPADRSVLVAWVPDRGRDTLWSGEIDETHHLVAPTPIAFVFMEEGGAEAPPYAVRVHRLPM